MVDVGGVSTVSQINSVIDGSKEAAYTFPASPNTMVSLSVVMVSATTPLPSTTPNNDGRFGGATPPPPSGFDSPD